MNSSLALYPFPFLGPLLLCSCPTVKLCLAFLFRLILSLQQWAGLLLADAAAWRCVSGTQRVSECESVFCLPLLCQSTSLKYQLGTQTHDQNKLATLSFSVQVLCRSASSRVSAFVHVLMCVSRKLALPFLHCHRTNL